MSDTSAPDDAAIDWNQRIIDEFRANGGRVGGPFEGATLALVTSVGAKSGVSRTNPVWYMRDGERLLLFATNGGAARNPGWYYNVLANPEIVLEVGAETFAARAEPVGPPERDELFAAAEKLSPQFTAYQAGIARTIPVVAVHLHDQPSGD
jgi:deazaflavin-dependent oxidoreductase (nitroreductase family)